MFNEIYEVIKNSLQSKNIFEKEQIIEEYIRGLKLYFTSYFPGWENYRGNMENFIKNIAKSQAKNETQYEKQYQNLVNELNAIVGKWKNILSVHDFVNVVGISMTNIYMKSNSLDNAVINSLNKQAEMGVILDSEEKVSRIIELLFIEYFDKNNPRGFTTNYDARAYITSKSKNELLKEMNKTARIFSNLSPEIMESSIRTSYAKNMASNLFQNSLDDNETKDIAVSSPEKRLFLSILNDINNANLNNKQKEYLINCLNDGNLQELNYYGVVPEQKLMEYESIITNKKKTY